MIVCGSRVVFFNWFQVLQVVLDSLTSARHEDDLGYIRIWATPPRGLVFGDGAPSLSIMVFVE